jgi:hypothetical protein
MQNKPNDVINVAVAGINDHRGFNRGTGRTANFTKIRNSRIAAICDTDDAKSYLTRHEYREPYLLPEEV